MPLSWQQFVAAAPRGTRIGDLAAAVGQPAAEVRAARSLAPCRRGKACSFAVLFAQWHGREPEAHEWPAPPRSGGGHAYRWDPPEDALLATLVGQMDATQIAGVLTQRLRKITNDPKAERRATGVKLRTSHLGLMATDLVGGLTVQAAGRELGSEFAVRNAINNGTLRTRRVGHFLLIPHDVWQAWRATRVLPPKGYVQLSRYRERLGIRSDKLSEFARMGFIPTAVRCNPSCRGQKSTKFGTWFVDGKVARRMVADRHAGRPMPWHGRALPDNLRATWKLYCKRRHPETCATCREIWGAEGAPKTLEEYSRRYPPLAHGAKRHLTWKWNDGVTAAELAREANVSYSHVQRAIANGVLRAKKAGVRRWTITRTDATRWKARHCPVGDSVRSWISLQTARTWYGFTAKELRAYVDAGQLLQRDVAGKGLVCRQQVSDLRRELGYTEDEAAKRVGVSVGAFRELLAGVDWRGTGRIPLTTVHAVIKRLHSQHGYTIEEAAEAVRKDEAWVRARIRDGTIRVTRTQWDRRRLYVTAPMLERLRAAARRKARPKAVLSEAWLGLSDAAELAGLTTATIQNWRHAGELNCRHLSRGIFYARQSVKARARQYWRKPKFKRAAPPAWYREEMARRHP